MCVLLRGVAKLQASPPSATAYHRNLTESFDPCGKDIYTSTSRPHGSSSSSGVIASLVRRPPAYPSLTNPLITPASRLEIVPLAKIGATTLAVFTASLGPFLYLRQGPQLVARLFPFTRGLMHAYWASK